MSIVSSNMISKHYCPQCNSFDLLKLHRNFLQKRILGSENKLQCQACGEVFKNVAFDQNIPIEVPVFIETANPIAVPAASSEKVEDCLHQEVDSDNTSTPVFNDPSVALGDYEKQEVLSEVSSAEPPQHSGNEQSVDETILVEQKKALWPYVVASLLVLFGTIYAFVWMPMSLSTEENGTIQVDMSIGKPVQMLANVSQPESEINSKPDLPLMQTNLSIEEPLVDKKRMASGETMTNLADDVSEEIVTNVPAVVKTEVPVVPIAVAELTSSITIETNNRGLEPRQGAKADIALGFLSVKSRVKKTATSKAADALPISKALGAESPVMQSNMVKSDTTPVKMAETALPETRNPLVQVPLPKTSVRQYRAKPPAITKRQALDHKREDIQEADKVVVNLVQASSSAVSSAKSVELDKAIVKKPVTAKSVKESDSIATALLLEKVAVKFIQQDLDKLLPQ